MIVGDSISTGYKRYLVENLTETASSNYEFVGEYEDDCGGGVKHSAASCTTSDQYRADAHRSELLWWPQISRRVGAGRNPRSAPSDQRSPSTLILVDQDRGVAYSYQLVVGGEVDHA